jgi:Protein of unknown function (DUF4435)
LRSITRHIDEFDIAQEVRMERGKHKGSFLLLEGSTDIKRFSNFINSTACSTVNSYGRETALKALDLLDDEGFEGVLAIVDADFDRILKNLWLHEAVIYSESHDLDLDWAQPDVVGRYLIEVGDPKKSISFGSTESIVAAIVEGLRPVSIARLLNKRGTIRHKLSDVDIMGCFVGLAVDLFKYVEQVCFKRGIADAEEQKELKESISRALSREIHDPFQITNGHDFNCALGIALRSELGNRREVHTWASEIELGIRLAYSRDDFCKSVTCRDIKAWEARNLPYRVLLSDLEPAVVPMMQQDASSPIAGSAQA